MVAKRYEVHDKADVKILGEGLAFRTSGRVARNRFLKASMTETLATWERENLLNVGIPTEALINLYDKWGHGGFGVVLTGNLIVDHLHLESAGNMVISKETWSEKKLEAYRRLAAVTKSDGALAIAQISHGGRQAPDHLVPHPYAPSDVQLLGEKFGNHFGKPRVLTLEEIQTEVIDRFVFTAQKVYEAGFDGVELHGAHGYLLAQFISPQTNLRDDRYGGSAEKRAQILVDIYNAIREKIPASTGFVIGIKLNSVEFQNHGLGLEDAVTTAKIVDATGFDFIEFSGGTYEHWALTARESTVKREGFFIQFTEAIKPHISNAVVYLTGGFRTAPGMVRAIKEGATDGIGIARPATAEPDLPKKIITGKVQAAEFNPVENQFEQSYAIATTQMGQAGTLPYALCNGNPAYGIFDQSNEKELAAFFEEFTKYYLEKVEKFKAGEPPRGVCPYRTKNFAIKS
ncbi:unnamed protein product [Bursaphelenchus xylophilus]|uniref:(pine wood nematode) hypothetical protein n=1 Tax=Bursaphelenchus xylophilus TaxID=6326 RepID=A0A1I7S639_BURXY|nr:unnamed protein product [Bursaphelenchus xylophilus]CAG9082300.1 unnamed protein product [Bursaphelenchus xylophilus]